MHGTFYLYFAINSFACRERLAIPISLLPGKASGVYSVNIFKKFVFTSLSKYLYGSLADDQCYVGVCTYFTIKYYSIHRCQFPARYLCHFHTTITSLSKDC
jgi:hypothetical protein